MELHVYPWAVVSVSWHYSCSRHDIAENYSFSVKQQSRTHSNTSFLSLCMTTKQKLKWKALDIWHATSYAQFCCCCSFEDFCRSKRQQNDQNIIMLITILIWFICYYRYFDLKQGIRDLSVFTPPSECKTIK